MILLASEISSLVFVWAITTKPSFNIFFMLLSYFQISKLIFYVEISLALRCLKASSPTAKIMTNPFTISEVK